MEFADGVTFKLATHYRQAEESILGHTLEWFIDRWHRVERHAYGEIVGSIMAVEAGVGRALSAALGGKRPRSLPDFEEAWRQAMDRIAEREDPTAHFWWLRPPEPEKDETEP